MRVFEHACPDERDLARHPDDRGQHAAEGCRQVPAQRPPDHGREGVHEHGAGSQGLVADERSDRVEPERGSDRRDAV